MAVAAAALCKTGGQERPRVLALLAFTLVLPCTRPAQAPPCKLGPAGPLTARQRDARSEADEHGRRRGRCAALRPSVAQRAVFREREGPDDAPSRGGEAPGKGAESGSPGGDPQIDRLERRAGAPGRGVWLAAVAGGGGSFHWAEREGRQVSTQHAHAPKSHHAVPDTLKCPPVSEASSAASISAHIAPLSPTPPRPPLSLLTPPPSPVLRPSAPCPAPLSGGGLSRVLLAAGLALGV